MSEFDFEWEIACPLYVLVRPVDAGYDAETLPVRTPLSSVVGRPEWGGEEEFVLPVFTSWRKAMRFAANSVGKCKALKLRTPKDVVMFFERRGEMLVVFNLREHRGDAQAFESSEILRAFLEDDDD